MRSHEIPQADMKIKAKLINSNTKFSSSNFASFHLLIIVYVKTFCRIEACTLLEVKFYVSYEIQAGAACITVKIVYNENEDHAEFARYNRFSL